MAENPSEATVIRLDRSQLLLVTVALFYTKRRQLSSSVFPLVLPALTKPITFSTSKSGRTLQTDGEAAYAFSFTCNLGS